MLISNDPETTISLLKGEVRTFLTGYRCPTNMVIGVDKFRKSHCLIVLSFDPVKIESSYLLKSQLIN